MDLLATGGGHPMTEIAERTFLPPPTLTKLMDQLVDDGIVHRRVDVMDRRRIRAYLTQRGLKRHRELLERVESAVDDLGLGDADGLAALLEATVQRLSGARAADAHPVPLRS
jgi:DNA-binding MarR family transcriptional regulator